MRVHKYMSQREKIHIINPKLKDIWSTVCIVEITFGFILGTLQYISSIFYYEKWGANAKALTLVATIIVLRRVLNITLEVPTGAIGDYLGRKKTVVLAFIFHSLAAFLLTWMFFIDSIIASFCFAIIIALAGSIAHTFYSGSFTAWIVDSVRERGVEEGHGPIIAKSYTPFIVAKAIGSTIGISLYLSGHIYGAFAIVCIATLLCAMYCAIVMKETEKMSFYEGKFSFAASFVRIKEIITNGLQIIIQTKSVLYTILFFSASMTVMLIILFFWAIAMKNNFGIEKMTIYWYVLVLVSFVSSFVGAKTLTILNERYLKKTNKRIPNATLWSWMICVALLIAISITALGVITLSSYINVVLFIVVIAIVNIGYGFLQPAYETLVNHYIPEEHSKERATIMSFGSMLTNVMLMLLIFPSSGALGKNTIIAWIIPGLFLLIVAIVINILMRRFQRKTGELPHQHS